MLASVLRSGRAVQMSIEVINAFVRLRRAISSQKDVIEQLSEVRSFMLKKANKTDRDFRKIWKAIEGLTSLKSDQTIGFKIDD